MENNFGFGFHQHPHLLSPNPNLMGFPFDDGYLNTEPIHRNPLTVEDFTPRNLPSFPFSGLQQSKASEPNNSENWFNLKPHFHQAFAPVLNSASKENFPAGLSDFGQQRSPLISTAPSQKRFLVFDQSGDKTTLLYSSGIHAPVQFRACRVPNPPTTCNLKEPMDNHLRLNVKDECIEDNSRDGTEDEIHEDTEELDALLCSDDDSDFSEDDETSTGHSPSTMTDYGIPKSVKEIGEEVDSFSVPTKRQKLSCGGYVGVQSNRYTSSSLKTAAACSALESDAESSCGDGSKRRKEELDSCSSGKRSRKEKIHETVSTLQSIIPDSNGKDAIVVIDEAIRYLKSLKVKAKALGLDAT